MNIIEPNYNSAILLTILYTGIIMLLCFKEVIGLIIDLSNKPGLVKPLQVHKEVKIQLYIYSMVYVIGTGVIWFGNGIIFRELLK